MADARAPRRRGASARHPGARRALARPTTLKVAVALAPPVTVRMRLLGAKDAADPPLRRRLLDALLGRSARSSSAEPPRTATVGPPPSAAAAPRPPTTWRQLDTYALAELFAALEIPEDAGSLFRARTLVALVADVTGEEDRIQPDDSIGEAKACVDRWLGFWNVYKSDFVDLKGPSRVAAMLIDTRYGKWALGAIAYRFGTSFERRAGARRARRSARPVTIAVVFNAILLAYAMRDPSRLDLGGPPRAQRRPRDRLPRARALRHADRGARFVVRPARMATADAAAGTPAHEHRAPRPRPPRRAHPTAPLRARRAPSPGLGARRRRPEAPKRRPRDPNPWPRCRRFSSPVLTLAAPRGADGARRRAFLVVERVFGLHGLAGELTIRAVQVRDDDLASWS